MEKEKKKMKRRKRVKGTPKTEAKKLISKSIAQERLLQQRLRNQVIWLMVMERKFALSV